jgi:hypothetical protein
MRPIMKTRRPLLALLFLPVFAAIVFVARYGLEGGSHLVESWVKEKIPETKENGQAPTTCKEDLSWMKPYQFTSAIQYVSRDIIAIPTITSGRPLLTKIEEPLFDDFTIVDLSQSQTIEKTKCLSPITLEVSHGKLEPADASHMIFGLQTTISRLQDTIKHLARWLPNTGARLYCIVVENEETPANATDMAILEKEFHDQGMNVTIIHPVSETDSFAQRYFSLVNVMYAARDSKTQWIVTIDDDTFFPSMHGLLDMLSTHDSSKLQYIGSLSEDWWAVNNYGLMGFGGASIILSVPMAKILDDNVGECKGHPRTTAGDVTIMDCVYRFSTTKLTHINALHQFDIYGDQSGFYESGREILSLHHWKGPQKLEMEKMHLVADICDNCFLQRWQFPNDLLLSNGYSITHYPLGNLTAKEIDLEKMEDTWNDDLNVVHSLGPTRPKLPEGVKISFKLLDSMLVGSDVVRQVYFKKGAAEEKDTVMVVNWRVGEREVGAADHKKAS